MTHPTKPNTPPPAIEPLFDSLGVTLYHADAFDILDDLYPHGWGAGECVILDPPWERPRYWREVAERLGEYESLLVFTDARRIHDPLAVFGPPAWLFTWDTRNTWNLSARRPVQQTKHVLWYGDHYDRDGELWGVPPIARNHPSTTQVPLDGRRLTDLWSESLRWLHYPGAGAGSAGTERFTTRQGHPAMRHAKPVDWVRCLIGNTSVGPVLDPFMGSGAAVVAAAQLGRLTIGVDIDRACCGFAIERLTEPRTISGQLDLFAEMG